MKQCCVALDDQRDWRDLRQLGQAIASVRWVDVHAARTASEPLIACGLWACREPVAKDVLLHRAKTGRDSLLVARFEPVDLAAVMGAPASILIRPAESGVLAWQDGQRFEVPSVTVIETAIPQGHWARSTAGTTVFAYRRHTQAGLIVLCTATVAGVALGADPAQQCLLLQQILKEMASLASARIEEDEIDTAPTVCATPSEYLEFFGPEGALVLLAALNAGERSVQVQDLEVLGAALPEDRLASLVAALPGATAREIEQTLRAAGWGAHLRMLDRSRKDVP